MDSLGRISEGTQMLFVIMIVLRLSMVESAAATGRTLSAHNSNASVDSTTTSQDSVLQWVQVTVVPLGVFLLGACICGIIHNTAAIWGSSFNWFGGGPSEATDEVPGANRLLTTNHSTADDLERGESQVELGHRHMDDMASTINTPVP